MFDQLNSSNGASSITTVIHNLVPEQAAQEPLDLQARRSSSGSEDQPTTPVSIGNNVIPFWLNSAGGQGHINRHMPSTSFETPDPERSPKRRPPAESGNYFFLILVLKQVPT